MKLMIDIQNYEVYYFDYLEGNFDVDMVLLFEVFLVEYFELIVDDELLVLQFDE